MLKLSVPESQFDRDPRRRQELRGRPIADAIYRRTWGEDVVIRRFEGTDDILLDKEHAIDVEVALPCGLLLTGQEKFLSENCARYRSVTVEYEQNQFTGERGDWFRLAPQFYFVGYFSGYAAFSPWILLNWPAMVIATHGGEIQWLDNANKDGRARASFRYCRMDAMPDKCIIAKEL